MKIAEGLEMLTLSAQIMGKSQEVHPVVIWDHETVILIDAGYPGQLPLIRGAMDKAGIPFEKVNQVILTHHDIDHIGSLYDITKELSVQVLAHVAEKPYIEGSLEPLKLSLFKEMARQPDGTDSLYQSIKAHYENKKVQVNRTLTDGEVLPICGGIRVIHTPGHTLGHICLFHLTSKTLIAGDLVIVRNGVLDKAYPFTNYDLEQTQKSLVKLTEFDLKAVICYHGGLFTDQVNERIAELAASR